MAKYQIEQWIPPYIINKIKELEGWVYFVTQVEVPEEEQRHVLVNYFDGKNQTPDFFINGELICKSDEEIINRLNIGL